MNELPDVSPIHYNSPSRSVLSAIDRNVELDRQLSALPLCLLSADSERSCSHSVAAILLSGHGNDYRFRSTMVRVCDDLFVKCVK